MKYMTVEVIPDPPKHYPLMWSKEDRKRGITPLIKKIDEQITNLEQYLASQEKEEV